MPKADQEKRMAENYEITQTVRIGGKEVVFGIDENCAEPYFCAFYTANKLFMNTAIAWWAITLPK